MGMSEKNVTHKATDVLNFPWSHLLSLWRYELQRTMNPPRGICQIDNFELHFNGSHIALLFNLLHSTRAALVFIVDRS